MKLIFTFLMLFSFATKESTDFNWKNMDTLNFELDAQDYKQNNVYFFYALLKEDSKERVTDHSASFTFEDHARPLDVYNYWEKRKDENYHVLFTKTAYTIHESSQYFTKDRLSDPSYLAKTMPDASITLKDSVYHLSIGFGAPDINYSLDFFTPSEFESDYPGLVSYFSINDGFEGDPFLIVMQHNFDYGRVMFQQTSKMSISISKHFELPNNDTLIINYTLNYIHNFPPEIIGGEDYLLRKIKDGILELIIQTQNQCLPQDK